MSEAPRDNNRVTTLLGTSNADGLTPVTIYTDPTTHRILVDASSSGLGVTDGAAFTAGSSTGTPAMGAYHSTIDTVADGKQAILGMTSKRGLFVNLQTSGGAETGVSATPLQVSLANTGANATAVKVDNSAVTQPVSGTITVQQTTASNLKVDLSGTAANATSLNVAVTGTPQVQGTVASGSSDADNPVKIGARATSSEITKVSDGQRVNSVADLAGKIVVMPYATSGSLVSGATSDIVDTTSTQVIAGVASNNLYITNILVTNSHATVSTFVNLQDGSGGTTLYTGYALAAGGGFSVTFPVPLKVTTAGNGLFAACATTGSNVRVSATGFKSTV